MKKTLCCCGPIYSLRLAILVTVLLSLWTPTAKGEDCNNCYRGSVNDGQPYTGVIGAGDCFLGNGRRYEIIRYIKPIGGMVTITTSSSCDTFMELMSSFCGGIGSNTNCPNAGGLGINPQNSCITTNLAAGTYYLCIFERTGANSCASYTVTVTEEEPAPAPDNDTCATAEELILEERSLGFNRVGLLANSSGDTTSAGGDTEDSICGPSAAPGVWYKVMGTGEAMTVSTCGSGYDTRLSLFSGGPDGDCGNLSCINANDDFCNLQSTVNWTSVRGVAYYILVHGYSTSSGTYTLRVTSDMPPAIEDQDEDGIGDDSDNCPSVANPDQANADDDDMGDVCDDDDDNDGATDDSDNCPNTSNSDQADCDEDGLGDACDEPCVVGGLQIPGDYNQDAAVDISDAISVFGYLFLGGEAPSCPGGLDFNGDMALDLSDGIGALNWLFQGGAGHSLGFDCVGIADCQNSCN